MIDRFRAVGSEDQTVIDNLCDSLRLGDKEKSLNLMQLLWERVQTAK